MPQTAKPAASLAGGIDQAMARRRTINAQRRTAPRQALDSATVQGGKPGIVGRGGRFQPLGAAASRRFGAPAAPPATGGAPAVSGGYQAQPAPSSAGMEVGAAPMGSPAGPVTAGGYLAPEVTGLPGASAPSPGAGMEVGGLPGGTPPAGLAGATPGMAFLSSLPPVVQERLRNLIAQRGMTKPLPLPGPTGGLMPPTAAVPGGDVQTAPAFAGGRAGLDAFWRSPNRF